MTKNKISLVSAILICLNTVLGAGLFINPQALTQMGYHVGFVGYILSAIILFPLILSMAELAKLHPVSGGLYVYSKEYLGSGMGFLSGWSYFVGKTVSATLLTHTFVSFVQSQSAFLSGVPTIVLDYIMISVLIGLNIIGVHIGGRAQYFFAFLKFIPLAFVFIWGVAFFDITFFLTAPSVAIDQVFSLIPISLYALVGFEIICAVGGFVENPARNIKRAILIAFCITAVIVVSFQFVIFGSVGTELMTSNRPILLLALKAFSHMPILGRLLNGFVFTSILGAAFSMYTGNCWNLHACAADNHLPGKKILTQVNKKQVPWGALLVEAIIAFFIITITKKQIPLQNMAVWGIFMSYLMVALAAYWATKKNKSMSIGPGVACLAVAGCLYVILLCLQNIIRFGISVPFLTVFFAGLLLSRYKKIFR